MNFITGLPPIIFKDIYVDAILVIVDRFTKMCLFFAVPSTITAPDLAELFHINVELKYGLSNDIVSDRGLIFTSKFWSNLCYLSHVKLRLSTAFHPQTDGQMEWMNQTLEHYLRCFVDTEQLTWPSLLRTAEFACNNAINATTGISPFQALLGYSPDFHLRIEDDAPSEEIPAAAARTEKLGTLRQKLAEY
jgi:transposase InsO family protein